MRTDQDDSASQDDWDDLPLNGLSSVGRTGKVLHIGPTTTYHLLAKGALTSVKIGRARRVHNRSIRRVIENGAP